LKTAIMFEVGTIVIVGLIVGLTYGAPLSLLFNHTTYLSFIHSV